MAYKLVERQQIYTGKKVNLELHRIEDEHGQQFKREIVVHPGAVVILPFLPDGRVLLIRQRRYTVGHILLELPAGTLEKGEDPINCAGRELQEETGFLAGKLLPIGSFYSSPGILTEKMYAFAAYDLVQTTQALEQGEDIELAPVPYDQAVHMAGVGEIVDGKTICALLMYDKRRQK
jgi:ADP-ribose pyrophosphatase